MTPKRRLASKRNLTPIKMFPINEEDHKNETGPKKEGNPKIKMT